jgi:RNA polymerase sigma-70 factor (ECF subfamily)
VITSRAAGHGEEPVSHDACEPLDPVAPDATTGDTSAAARFRALVDEHVDFTWRSLRRLGLSPDLADDATQRVFLVASQKLSLIEPGRERAFLFQTAVRVASSEKRSFTRRREDVTDAQADDVRDATAGADELIDRARARALLDAIVAGMEMDVRTVFVLFELEGMTTVEIARTLGVPRGTVASRLRRGREEFRDALKRYEARSAPRTRRT